MTSEMTGITSAKANTHSRSESYAKHPAKDLTASQLLIARHSRTSRLPGLHSSHSAMHTIPRSKLLLILGKTKPVPRVLKTEMSTSKLN